jgi:O-antigen/teichoic acid export membrane protein
MKNLLQSQFVINLSWNVIGGILAKIVGPLFSILVFRILEPRDCGLFAIVVAIKVFIDMFRGAGMSSAIIISNDKKDFISFQFTVQFFLALLIFFLLLIVSPLIAYFFQQPGLKNMLLILSIVFFFNAVEDPLITHHLKNNHYKILFYRQIIPSFVLGGSALLLAWLGLGIYSLVWAQFISSFCMMLFFLLESRWKPRFYFEPKLFVDLFAIGKHEVMQNIFSFLVQQGDALVLGKNIGVVSLGFYKMGAQVSRLLPDSLTGQIAQVIFTDIAKRNDKKFMSHRYYQFINFVTILILIYSICFFILAPWLVSFVLGEKWENAVIFARLFVLQLPFLTMVILNQNLAKLLNFIGIYTKFTFWRSIITILGVIWFSFFSIYHVIFWWLMVGVIAPMINAFIFFKFQNTIHFKKSYLLIVGVNFLWLFLGVTYVMPFVSSP